MTATAWLQIGLYIAVLLLLVKPLGAYMARVYQGERTFLHRAVGPVERLIYHVTRVSASEEMNWKTYSIALLLFNLAGFVLLFALLRLQGLLPFNPQGLPAMKPDTSLNTAVSFVTNTNWQSYAGEVTVSYLTQMAGLAVQNFLSAASGMAVLAAMIRGFARHSAATIGNFWVDTTRSVLYILLPLSLVLAVALVSQGAVQTFDGARVVPLVEPVLDANGQSVVEQVVPLGPAASQVAIKQLGTNGGGFFNANSAHPLENPTPLTNFLEMLAILLIPAALCYTFGRMVGDRRQGCIFQRKSAGVPEQIGHPVTAGERRWVTMP